MRKLHFYCLLFLIFSVSASALYARAVPNIYLQVNRGFSDSDNVTINLIANFTEDKRADEKVFIRMVLYTVEDPAQLFVKNNYFDFNQSLPDTLLSGLKLLKSWDENIAPNTTRAIELGRLREGVYMAEAIYRNYIVRVPVFVSNYAIVTRIVGNEALAFVANKRTGKALINYKAYIGNYRNALLEDALDYKNGIAKFSLSDSFYFYNTVNNLPVIIIYDGNKMTAANTYVTNFNNQNVRQFNSRGYVFTDRPVYRPEQWVRFQGIFREKQGMSFRVMEDSLAWIINDAKGQQIAKGRAKLDKNGNFGDSILLEKNAALGSWSIMTNLQNTKFGYTATFNVEEYKKPEFVVTVTPEKTIYKAGDKITATIEAKYLFGSVVENAEVVYQVMRKPISATNTSPNKYEWFPDTRNGFVNSSPQNTNTNNYGYYYTQETIFTTGKSRIDKSGKCKISFQTHFAFKSNDEYTIIAYVTDASRRSISASATCIVSYNDLQLSAWREKNYYKPGEEILVHAQALDFSGNPVQARVKSTLYFKSAGQRQKVQSVGEEITNTDGELTCKYKAAANGNYYVEMKAKAFDKQMQPSNFNKNIYDNSHEDILVYNWAEPVELKLDLTVLDTASAFKMWYNQDRNNVKILTDKQVYKQNEKLSALIYIPFDADVFVTLNSNSLGHYNTYHFTGSKNVFDKDSGSCRELKIDLDKDITGDVQLYIAAIQNGNLIQQSYNFNILPETKMLNVDISFDKQKYRPGTKAKAKIKVTDVNGKPISNANISLGTADESIYAMGPDKTPHIGKIFQDKETIKSATYFEKSPVNMVVSGAEMNRQSSIWRAKQLGSKYSKKTFLGENEWYQVSETQANFTSVEGYIISHENGFTLPHAQIQIGGNTFYADENGYYYIRGFNPNINNLDIDFIDKKGKLSLNNLSVNGFKKISLNVAIPSDSDQNISVERINSAADSVTIFSPEYWSQGEQLSGNIDISGNEASIKIKVKDGTNNRPLNFVSVRLYNEKGVLKYSSPTDNNGYCKFRKVKHGRYFISVAYMDYRQQRIDDIIFRDNRTMEIKISLKPEENVYSLNNNQIKSYHNSYKEHVSQNSFADGDGFLRGRIVDEDKEPLGSATIFLMEDGVRKAARLSDFDGDFKLGPVAPGIYDLIVKYVGYPDRVIQGITIKRDKTVDMPNDIVMDFPDNWNMSESVTITRYRDPEFSRDETTQMQVINRRDVKNLATRDVNSAVSTSGGVVRTDKDLYGRGGRTGSNVYYVDGIKMTGAPGYSSSYDPVNIPANAISFNEAAIRENFKDVIFWDNTIITNDNGEAEIEIDLPDNLTGWQTTARVITADAKVGQAIANIKVSKDLLVRMEVPRFITLGDTLVIATNIHNYLDKEKTVKVSLEADGLHIRGSEKMLQVAAGAEARVDWTIESKTINKAKLTVKALTDEESDAMVMEVPVQPYGLEVSEPLFVDMKNSKTKKVSFDIPKEIDLRTASLEVNVSPSMTAAMLSAMSSLISYPYGCVEQTMSRFIPLVLAVNTIKTLGDDYNVNFTQDELNKMVAQGSNRLAELQNADGSWGWWSKDQPNAFMTAYVCYGLNLARSAGYNVPENAYQKGLNALRSQIENSGKSDAQSFAYKMMVAMQCGLVDLWPKYKKLQFTHDNAYTKALWLQAAYYAGDVAMAKLLIKDLEKTAIHENGTVTWSENKSSKNYYYNWQDDPVEASANVVKALILADADNKLIEPAARWIIIQREGNSWHNTRQTAMCIFALNELIKKELRSEYKLAVLANGNKIGDIKVSGKDVYKAGKTYTFTAEKLLASTLPEIGADSVAILVHGNNSLEVQQAGEGQWFLSARLNYYLNLDDKHAEKLADIQKANLFTLEREYYKIVAKRDINGTVTYKKTRLDKKAIKPGDDILVKVKVTSKTKQEYVLIEDPIPAGCEFIRETQGYIIDGENAYNGYPKNALDWYTNREMRDSKLALMITTFNPGTYEYSYLVKAQIPGNYRIAPAVAQLMYYPEKRGFSNFFKLNISEEQTSKRK